MVLLSYKCQECDVLLKREVKRYKLEDFHPKGTKSILLQTWCSKCRAPLLFRYSFKEKGEQTVEAYVVAYLKSTTAFIPRQEKKKALTARPHQTRKRGPS